MPRKQGTCPQVMQDGSVCARPLHARGYCSLHLARLKSGKPAMDAPFAKWTKPAAGTCSQPNCEGQSYSRSLCTAHYQRLLHGVSLDHPIKRHAPLPERVEQWLREATETANGCLLCASVSEATGYGTLVKGDDGKSIARHRAVYKIKVGDIPPWAQIHHACANKACLNPEHLVLASQKANTAEMHARNEYERRLAHLEALLAEHHCEGCACAQ